MLASSEDNTLQHFSYIGFTRLLELLESGFSCEDLEGNIENCPGLSSQAPVGLPGLEPTRRKSVLIEYNARTYWISNNTEMQ